MMAAGAAAEPAPLTVAQLVLGCGFNKPDPATDQLAVVPHAQAVATVHAALRLGIRALDTAPLYGSGRSEEWIGDALALPPLGVELADLQIWSKVGVVVRRADQPDVAAPPLPLGYGGARASVRDYSRAMARRGLAESLGRLRLPAGLALAGLRVHGPNRSDRVTVSGRMVEAVAVDGTEQALGAEDGILGGLAELRAEGAIGEVGLGLQ
jgi:aryl-alcohol dehydrogenase-like predicted oxidoreductase